MKGAVDSEYSIIKSKCVFLGEHGAGKTSIILRFMHDTFDPAYHATIGIDFVSKTLCFNEKSVRRCVIFYLTFISQIRLQLWDTAGQERFSSLIPSYIKDSSVAIVVYDVTSRESFVRADKWIAEIRTERPSKTLVFLVGNKVDLEDKRVVTTEEAAKKAEKENLFFVETSAKTDFQIKKLFDEVVVEVVKSINNSKENEPDPNGNVELDKENGYWKCWCF
ncbi:Ras- protein RABH1b, variant 3 [Schistosoma haematobium]|uniref:Ras- protein RABH1b, variant 3 n=1 Tax=Schistosoma haematobium TaxID=6185 RepID=A0A922LT57_SCHHA|nr:Ras- protein RABH1b, variant 3 [Schistosoma haematobium]KAH9592918.1 Ras- protein RABH1b, variant 3 [Schistosoma haematobium]